jgi:hypothetical protein
MSFEIKVDADVVMQQFDTLQQNIEGLSQELPQTFTDWQREDMHRHFPKTDSSGSALSETMVSTSIYPRSRLRRVKNLAGGQSTRRRSIVAVRRAGGQHRPILRPELFEKLEERMTEMCKKAITWQ